MLFAETGGDGKLAVLMTVCTLVGGAFSYVLQKWWEWRSAERAEADKRQQTIVDHQKALIERIDAEKKAEQLRLDNCNEENDALQREIAGLKLVRSTMRRHIRYLESILSRATLSFERYEDEPTEPAPPRPGSGPHSPLPPAPEQGGQK